MTLKLEEKIIINNANILKKPHQYKMLIIKNS